MNFGSELGFLSAKERLQSEADLRFEATQKKLPFGMRYLDRALGAILPTDLVLIGASTGSGKTEMVVNIAMENIKAGRKVYFLALEAEEAEIERRLKYKMIAERYYADGNTEPISFQDWYYGDIDLSEYEKNINLPALDNLFTRYRTADFRPEHLTAAYHALKGKADLIILDHLHYIDMDDEDSNAEMKNLLKTIKSAATLTRTPCVAVAHLRKKNGDAKKDIAELDDFHGSSNITKIATKVILMQAGEMDADGNSITYIHAAKNRHGGERTKYLAAVKFNPRTNSYLPEVALFGVSGGKVTKQATTPHWMRR